MRKILILVFSFFVFSIMQGSADVNVLSSKQIKYYGEGVLNIPENCSIYAEPDKNSEVIRQINRKGAVKTAVVRKSNVKKISYLAYIPSAKTALLAVDLNEENGWYKVFLNQQTGETGWVYTDNRDAFYTYKSLFYKYGRKYGVRLFNDLPDDKKVIYSKQSETSQKLEQLTFPKFITFTIIMGNWMLVSVKEIEEHAKVGWFRWRNDDGTLNMFPNFSEQRW